MKKETEDDSEEWDIYFEEKIHDYVEDDEISASEQGFMSGYLAS